MLNALLIAAAQGNPTESWNGTQILIITATCLLVLFITSRTIERPHDGPKMPLPFPSLFNNVSVGGFLGAMSFGHVLGVLAYMGLAPYLQ